MEVNFLKRNIDEISGSLTLQQAVRHNLEVDTTIHFLFGSVENENERLTTCTGDAHVGIEDGGVSDTDKSVQSHHEEAKPLDLLAKARRENDIQKMTQNELKKAGASRAKKYRKKKKNETDPTVSKAKVKAKNEKALLKRLSHVSSLKAALDSNFVNSTLVETAVGFIQYVNKIFYIELKPNCDILNKANGNGSYCIMIKNSLNLFCYKFCIAADANVDYSKDNRPKVRVIVVKSLSKRNEIDFQKDIRYLKSYSITFEAKACETISEIKSFKKHAPPYIGKSRRIRSQPHFFKF